MTKSIIPLIILTIVGSSCRSRRQTPETFTPKKLEVNLVEQSGAYETGPTQVFSLTGCGEVKEEGKLENGKVIFGVAGVSAGDKCRFEVIDRTKTGVKWLHEQYVIYLAPEVQIALGNRGQLVGTAELTKGFLVELPEELVAFRLLARVKFPGAPAGEPLSAQLLCEPTFSTAGSFAKTSETAGTFIFETALGVTNPAHTCSRITVSEAGKKAYEATLKDATFTPRSGDVGLTATEIELVKLDPLVSNGLEVTIKLEEDECDKDGFVFDLNKRECIKSDN